MKLGKLIAITAGIILFVIHLIIEIIVAGAAIYAGYRGARALKARMAENNAINTTAQEVKK